MSYLWILILCTVGFLCLALAMERHQIDLFDGPLGSGITNTLRTAGWVMLLGALFVVLRQPAWVFGLVAWFGCLSAGAGVVFLALVLLTPSPRSRFKAR